MSRVKDILRSVSFPKHFRVLDIHLLDEGIELFSCEVRVKKGEIILQELKRFTSLEELGSTESQIPCLAMINGRGILTKTLNAFDRESDPLKTAFPAVKESSVYFGATELRDNCYLEVVRRETVDELLAQWPKNHQLLDLQIGSSFLIPFLDGLFEDEIQIGLHSFNPKTGDFSISENNIEVDFLGEKMDSSFSAAFAYALVFTAQNAFSSEIELLKTNRENWLYSRFSKSILQYGLASVLTVLLVSFLVYSNYRDQNAELALAVQDYQYQSERLAEMQQNLDRKRGFLEYNKSEMVASAKMLDQVAACLPKKVSIERFQSHPVRRIKEKEGKVLYDRNMLEISGKTKEYDSFRTWVDAIKKLSWVKSLSIKGYQELTTGHEALFTVEIQIRGDEIS